MKFLSIPKYTTVPILVLLVSQLTFTSKAAGQATGTPLVIAPNFYHVDEKHHLIVINKPIEEIMAATSEGNNSILLDKEYSFTDTNLVLGAEHSYTVQNAAVTYTVYFTKLPIIHVNTRYSIVDAPSVYATFAMSETSGTITTSKVGIEVRGSYSQNHPKKSYELSFWADTLGSKSQDVKLLGMRTDNKWNLQALYNEPLRSNSKVANELWQEMSTLYYRDKEPDAKNGIAMAYAELFINDEYKGIYTLTERIDKKQLKLKKYTTSIKGELYKGSYWGGAVTFTDLPIYDNTNSNWGGFEYKHPEEYTDWTNLYSFVSFVETSSDAEFIKQYPSKFDIKNAVDYYIFMNVLRATDNYGKNLYIAKYNVEEPYFYVPWDLDGVFGTTWTGQRDGTTDDLLTNGFYKRLNQDCSATGFRSLLGRRWAELRATILTPEHIMAKFTANNAYLQANSVYQREQAVWTAFSYDAAQLPYVTDWLTKRLAYLDQAFSQRCVLLSAPAAAQGPAVKLYPNPASDYLLVEASTSGYEVCIQDISGRVVLKTVAHSSASRLDISQLTKGMYVVLVKGGSFVATQKLLLN